MEAKPADDLGSLAAAAASFPLLVYDHGEQPAGNSQTVLSVADGSTRTYQVPELSNLRCVETPQGLVLTVDTASLECSLWNPQTGEKTALPAMDVPLPEICRCLVTHTSSSAAEWDQDSLVLVYDQQRPKLLLCRIGGGTGATWVRQTYDIAAVEGIDAMAAAQGIFYFLGSPNPGVVGAFRSCADDPELRLEVFTVDVDYPTIASDAPRVFNSSYLLESSGDLFLVCIFYLGCTLERVEEIGEVGAYTMDFTRKKWCKVTDIGDRAFLLGPSFFAASCSATENGLKKGCVYFTYDIFADSDKLYIFDLNEGTRELAGPTQDIFGNNKFHIFDLKEGTRELAGPTQDIPALSRKPFWLVPEFVV